MAAQKTEVTLDGVALAGTSGIAWKFVSGTQPYTTLLTVHTSKWEQRLKAKMGTPLELVIVDSRGVKTTVKEVYILQAAPSDSPHRTTFVVADKRWKWNYHLIARDFNMPRKTGSRTARIQRVPIESRVVVDDYDFLPYSLNAGKKWTAKAALEEVLKLLEDSTKGGSYRIESFPINDSKVGSAGEFTLQGVSLRDQGDMAVARLLSFIPGADVYINADGVAVVFDASDLDAAEAYFKSLPAVQWDGEAAAWIDRKQTRPKSVLVHYQREVEVLFEFADDYSGNTASPPDRNAPLLENVLPTVDPSTQVTYYDTQLGRTVTDIVPSGTWVPVAAWLAAMDATRTGPIPWTFDTIKRYWLAADLDGVFSTGLDASDISNNAARVQALRQHFRQTFRINRRYTERFRDIRAIRVGLIDPVTGARAHAAVWGQACRIPTEKGKRIASNKIGGSSGVFVNVDYLAYAAAHGLSVIDTVPGPAQVDIIDEELGIFRVDWMSSPYGDVDSYLPCNVVDASGALQVVQRDLSQQDTLPMGTGVQVESGANGIFLRDSLRLKVLLTVVPASPNNLHQFHRMRVRAEDVAEVFRTEFRIRGGAAVPLEVFVPPGEVTARFAWSNDTQAAATIVKLLGLDDGPRDLTADLDNQDLPGFVLVNEDRHLTDHAISTAAELLAAFSDSIQGAVVTRVPAQGAKLIGNMSGATIRVASAPSAKVDVVHQFPGQQRAISRLALMPEATRAIVLGIVPFKK